MVRRVLDGLMDDYEEETITYLLDYLMEHDPETIQANHGASQTEQANSWPRPFLCEALVTTVISASAY